jgi:DeoR/GlpR family transcriptional regulator of sugar metabolism
MLNAERRTIILEALGRDGRVVASELSARFGVSEDTVRRDLRELAEEGLLMRVYGGAVRKSPVSRAYSRRKTEFLPAKSAIGEAAVKLIREGQVLFIDGGTTPLEVAIHLPPDLRVTIVTHSLPVASALAEHPNAQVIVLGGSLYRDSLVMVGATTAEAYRQIHADLCVLGIASIHPRIGLGVLNQEEAEVKRAMLAGAAEVMVVASGEKLNTVAPFLIGPVSLVTRLVTDPEVPDEALQAYREAGVEVVRPKGR